MISRDSSTGSVLNEAHHEQIDHVEESSELDESNAKRTREYTLDNTTITTTNTSYQPSSLQYHKLTISEVDELVGMNSTDEASAIIRECLALRSKWQGEHPLAPQDIIIPDTIDYDQAPTYDVFNTSPPPSTIMPLPIDQLMSFEMVEGVMSIITVDTASSSVAAAAVAEDKSSFHVMSYLDFVHDYNKVSLFISSIHIVDIADIS